jgi:hypothetical protein
MDSGQEQDGIHITLTVPKPIKDSIVSDITEHLRKNYSETTLISIDEDKGHLFFRCDTEDPSIRDSFGNLFQQWLNTQTIQILNYRLIRGRI